MNTCQPSSSAASTTYRSALRHQADVGETHRKTSGSGTPTPILLAAAPAANSQPGTLRTEPLRYRNVLSEILPDPPDITGGVGKGGGAHPPRPVHRPVEQLHSVSSQLGTHRIHIIDEH